MYAIQHYRFLIGTKIPFSDWPQIAERFLSQQSLRHDRLLYYFKDSFGACPRAVKNCPNLGPVRSALLSRPLGYSQIVYLSNIEDGVGCTEAEIMSLMPKIHRRYGFSESYIIYQDVDFFSRPVPTIIRAPGNAPDCIKGCSITLYRDSVFPRWSGIELQIVIHDGTTTLDATPYRDAMAALLPKVRCMESLETVLSPEEEVFYKERNAAFLPLKKQAAAWFAETIPEPPENRTSPTDLTLAPVLKKLCRKFGFTYVTCDYSIYYLYRRISGGHYIRLEIDVGPNTGGTGVVINFDGLGFNHRLYQFWFLPQNTADAAVQMQKLFEALTQAEQELFPALAAHFLDTPEWYLSKT